MSGRRERRPNIMDNPPAGSRFANYVRYLERIEEEGRPWWQHPNQGARAMQLHYHLSTGAALHEFPATIVREFFVEPHYRSLGMPDGLSGKWFDDLLNDVTECIIAVGKANADEAGSDSTSAQGGLPPAELVMLSVYLAELIRSATKRDNPVFEAVADRLGPGIDRHIVRRAIRPLRRALTRARERFGEETFAGALNALLAQEAELAALDSSLRICARTRR